MPGTLSFETLKTRVADGSVDTVLACLVDMQETDRAARRTWL